MKEFCVGLAIMFLCLVIFKPKGEIKGLFGISFLLGAIYGLGYIVTHSVLR